LKKSSILKQVILSEIQPVVHLENQCPVFVLHEGIGEIVIAVYQEQIAHGFVSPLQPAVDVEIVPLVVVLQEGGPKKIVGEIHFDPVCDQEQVVFAIGFGKSEVGLLKAHAEITPGLNTEGSTQFVAKDTAIEKLSGFNICFEIEFFSAVGIVCPSKGRRCISSRWDGFSLCKGGIE
jgi:hypothetical protein